MREKKKHTNKTQKQKQTNKQANQKRKKQPSKLLEHIRVMKRNTVDQWVLTFHPKKCHVLTLGKFYNITHTEK